MKTKKSLSVVVVTSLLLLVAISAVIFFGNYYEILLEKVQGDAEKTYIQEKLEIKRFYENNLYLYNPNKNNVDISEILIGGEPCNIDKNISFGFSKINVDGCAFEKKGKVGVVVITKNKIFEKSFFVKESLPCSSGLFCGGEGLEISPYKIGTCEQLQNMKDDLTSHFVLIKDIDCVDTKNWNLGDGFEPIKTFKGSFDGRNFVISNLFINRSGENGVGLFGVISSNVEISNVGLVDVELYGYNNVGGLAGLGGSGIFTNNFVTGSVNGHIRVGGIVGLGNNGNFIKNYATAKIEGDNHLGGLVGLAQFDKTTFTNNYATGDVIGTSNTAIGGLVGSGNQGTFTNNYATGDVSSSYGFAGSGSCTTSNSYYNSEINPNGGCGSSGKTTSELQTPTTNTGIYSNWDLSIWDFGTSSEYPTLR